VLRTTVPPANATQPSPYRDLRHVDNPERYDYYLASMAG
jgi:hypothetical protein